MRRDTQRRSRGLFGFVERHRVATTFVALFLISLRYAYLTGAASGQLNDQLLPIPLLPPQNRRNRPFPEVRNSNIAAAGLTAKRSRPRKRTDDTSSDPALIARPGHVNRNRHSTGQRRAAYRNRDGLLGMGIALQLASTG